MLVCPSRLHAAPPQAAAETAAQPALAATDAPPALELSRPVRPWEFLSSVGMRAGIFGHESGHVEAWVYPLKVLREFELLFRTGDRTVPAAPLARTLIVRPEATTIVYAGDAFTVRATFFVPVDEPGAVIALEIETLEPLEVIVTFQRDFQLMWPAGLGATYSNWNEPLRAYAFGEETRRFFALVGAPSAVDPRPEYETNYTASTHSSFRLGVTERGLAKKAVVIAASFEGQAAAEKTYQRLTASHESLRQEAAEYYARYLAATLSLKLPDPRMQQAYDWSRVSVLQGLVENPFLGRGLIAGYGPSGTGARPGYAWFFGRDALWTVLALNSTGDFATARTALEFLARYQRADGKVPHEIAQSASFVRWFEDYPYGWAAADATPLFLIVVNDYVVHSGDVAFAKDKWPHIRQAYQFLRSTWDEQGFPKNDGVGHGWVEGGPLLPVKTEFYQSGVGLEALRALSNLARLVGENELSQETARAFESGQRALEQAFWSPEKQVYAFALDADRQRSEAASVLATVPMWFGLLDGERSAAMLRQLAEADHATDWGMRILSSRDPRYSPAGYHYGTVWPLFTGWASVGEYRYHRAQAAFANLNANAMLALDGAPGRVTELLSGTFYEPLSRSTPHQIWSAAMVTSPLLRGLLGLEVDATALQVKLSPHMPPSWGEVEVRNLRAGKAGLDVTYDRDADAITLDVEQAGPEALMLEFSPAVSLRAQVVSVAVNDRPVPFRVEVSDVDQHVSVRLPLHGGRTTLRIRLKNDFALELPHQWLPPLGSKSRNLKVLSESWSSDRSRLDLEVSGLAGSRYEVWVWGGQQISSVEGGQLAGNGERRVLKVRLPGGGEDYRQHKITLQFASTAGARASPPKRWRSAR